MWNVEKHIFKWRNISRGPQKILINTLLSFLLKGGTVLISLFLMPAYMDFFDNNDVLGMWFTIVSVFTWILTFDFGVGNGLRNYLVKPLVDQDIAKIKKYISSAYITVGIFLIVVLFLGIFFSTQISWNSFFHIQDATVPGNILLNTVQLVFGGIILQFFLRLINSIYYAMQRTALPGLLGLISNVFLLIFLLNFKSGNLAVDLVNLAMVHVVSTNVPFLLAHIVTFSTSLKKCVPNINFLDKQSATELFRLGGAFFWLQIMVVLIFGSNEFLIAYFVSPKDVVEYQIYNKLFGLISTTFNLALTPVWSAVTEACVQKNYIWIKKLYGNLRTIWFVVAIFEVLLIIPMQMLVDFWLVDKSININGGYAIIFAIWGISYVFMSINSSIVNGMGVLKTQAILLGVGVLLNIICAKILVMMFDSWIAIVISNIIAMLPYNILQPLKLLQYLSKCIKKQMVSN